MTGKRKEPAQPLQEPEEEPEADEAPPRAPVEPATGADEFLQLLASIPGDADSRIDVYRVTDGSPEYMGKTDTEGFSLDAVRERWGGGKFQFRSFVDGNYNGARTIRIAGPRKEFTEATESEPREPDPATVARLENASMAETVRMLAEELRELRRQMQAPPAAAATANPLQMTTELMTTVQLVMQPYLDAAEKKRDAGGFTVADALELVQMGMDMAGQRASSTAAPANPYDSVLANLGIPLLKQLQEQGAQERTMHDNPPPAAAPRPETAAPHSSGPMQALAPWVPRLNQWAAQGKDPGLRAEFIVDELNDEWLDVLAGVVLRPGSLTEFLTAFPSALRHQVWYEQLWGHLVEILRPEPDADDGNDQVGDEPKRHTSSSASPDSEGGVIVGHGVPPDDDDD